VVLLRRTAQCLDGNDAIALCHLALVECLGREAEPDGRVCCLSVCPEGVSVAILSVALILFLAIGPAS